MIIGIAGSSGYIGSNFSKYLKERGFDVIEISRAKGVNYFDKNSLAKFIKDCDIVFNFVGISREDSRNTFFKINYLITKNLVDICEEFGVKKFIYNSGLGVSSYGKNPFTTNNYFLSKLEAEKEIINSDLNYVIFRPSYIIGRNDELIPNIVNSALKKKEVLIIEDGKYRIQPIYLLDALEIYLKSIKIRKKRIITDLVGKEKITYLNFVKKIIKFLKLNVKIKFISKEEAEKKFNLSKEEIDVLLCNETSDYKKIEKLFNVKLHSIREILLKEKIIT